MEQVLSYRIEILGTETQVSELTKLDIELKKLANEKNSLSAVALKMRNANQQETEEYKVITSEIDKNRVTSLQLNNQKKELTTTINQSVKENSVATGSLNDMRLQLIALKKQYAEMPDILGANKDAGIALAKQTNDLNNKVKTLEESTGVHTRSVGNYAKGMQGLTGILGLVGKAFGLNEEAVQKLEMAHMMLRKGLRDINHLSELGIGVKKAETITTETQTVATEANAATTKAQTVATKAQTVAQIASNWVKTLSIPIIGWIIGALAALVGVIYGVVTALKEDSAAEIEHQKALDGTRIKSDELRKTFNESLKTLEDLRISFALLNGTISETEASIKRLKNKYVEDVDVIKNESLDKITEIMGFWHSLGNLLIHWNRSNEDEINDIKADARSKAKKLEAEAEVQIYEKIKDNAKEENKLKHELKIASLNNDLALLEREGKLTINKKKEIAKEHLTLDLFNNSNNFSQQLILKKNYETELIKIDADANKKKADENKKQADENKKLSDANKKTADENKKQIEADNKLWASILADIAKQEDTDKKANLENELKELELAGENTFAKKKEILENDRQLVLDNAKKTGADVSIINKTFDLKLAELKKQDGKDRLAELNKTLDKELELQIKAVQKEYIAGTISKEQLNNKIEQLNKKRLEDERLIIETRLAELSASLTSTVGMTIEEHNLLIEEQKRLNKALGIIAVKEADDKKTFQETYLNAELEGLQGLADIKGAMLDLESQKNADRLKQDLDVVESVEKGKLDALETRHKAGLISDANYEKQKAAIEKKAKAEEDKLQKEALEKQKKIDKSQAIIAGALSIMRIWASQYTGTIADIVLKAIQTAAVVAMTGIQIAKIDAQKFAGGGKVPGTFAAQDNIPVFVSPGEAIVNPYQQALLGGSRAFQRAGVPGFAGGGLVPDYFQNNSMNVGLTREEAVKLMVSGMNNIKVQQVESDVTTIQKRVQNIEYLTTI